MNENRVKSSTSKRRKTLSAMLAVAMVLTMLLSGTLAYYYRSLAVNEFSGVSTGKNVVGHDDFDPETGNKDVYMENLGSTPVYVRIRLTEDFQISEKGGSSEQMTAYTNSESYNKSYDEKTLANGNVIGAHNHGYWTTATTDTENMDFASADDPDFHSTYFKWTMGGATSQKTYLSAASDEYSTNPEDPKYKDADAPVEGEDEGTLRVVYDTKNEKDTYSFTDNDNDGKDDTEEFVKQTPAQSDIIAMTAWQKLSAEEKYNYTGWVLDNFSAGGIRAEGDAGWYYWSQPVMGGEATGLLLDQVETLPALKNGDYSYQYHIHVEFEAVDEIDKGLWLSEFSSSHSGDKWDAHTIAPTNIAQDLIRFVSDKAQYGTQQRDLIDALNTMNADYETKAADSTAKYSSSAWSLVKQALDKVSEGDMETALELKTSAEKMEAEYQDALAKGEDPDAVLFSADTLTTNFTLDNTKVDSELFAYLIKNYDLNDDDTISKEEAKGITEITINPNYVTAEITHIKTLNGVTAENFPNLVTLNIRGADIKSVDTAVLPKTLETIGLNYMPLVDLDDPTKETTFDLTPFTTDMESLSLCGTNITGIKGLDTKKIKIESLDIRQTHITSFTVPADSSRLLCGGQAHDDGKIYLGSLESQVGVTPEVYGTLDLSAAKNLTRLYMLAHSLQRIDVSAVEKMKSFPEFRRVSSFNICIKREDQTLPAAIPAEKIFIRQHDGTLLNSAGQPCNEDGTVKEP